MFAGFRTTPSPFLTSFLLRVLAWKVMVGDRGVVNSLLVSLHLRPANEPIEWLLYSQFTVMLVLAYVWIPFVALPIFVSLDNLDRSLLEAASDLGASRVRTFLRVTLPLSLPGLIAAFVFVFVPTIGEFVTPLLVGGASGYMYGNAIQDLFTRGLDWQSGSVLAMVFSPLVIPYLVFGISLLLLFTLADKILTQSFGFYFGLGLHAVVIGHVVVALPYTILTIMPLLERLSVSLDEAAKDLGASPRETFRRVTLPLPLPALISAFLVAFTLSFDEFAIASFLAGTQQDLARVPVRPAPGPEPAPSADRGLVGGVHRLDAARVLGRDRPTLAERRYGRQYAARLV